MTRLLGVTNEKVGKLLLSPDAFLGNFKVQPDTLPIDKHCPGVDQLLSRAIYAKLQTVR